MSKMQKIEDRPTWNSMSTPKVMERMEMLYESNKWHDCVFKLFKSDGSGEELVFAHSLVLASSSPVFEALCFGPMAEVSPISVPDVDPIAFRMMLKFIYTDQVEFTSAETACNVLYAAKKYLIYTLAGLAISYISIHINESNCLQIHEFAKYVHEERLVQESWRYLCSHLGDVFDVLKYSPDEYISNDIIKTLVNEEALNCGELVLFKICQHWAEFECRRRNLDINGDNLRQLLMEMDVLSKIRWLTLTQEEFEDEPVNSGILKEDEIKCILSAIQNLNLIKMCVKSDVSDDKNCISNAVSTVQGSQMAVMLKSLSDSSIFPISVGKILEERKKIPLKRIYCHRFIETENRLTNSMHHGFKICTLVTANKSVRLTGIFLNAKIMPIPQLNLGYLPTCLTESDYLEKISVTIADKDNKVLFSVLFSETVKYGTVFKIPLDKPLILERNEEYKIMVQFLNSVENNLFGVRNSISKFPSGLCVTFKERACMVGHGRFIDKTDWSVISGLELYL